MIIIFYYSLKNHCLWRWSCMFGFAVKMRLVLQSILRVQREAFEGNPPLGVAC